MQIRPNTQNFVDVLEWVGAAAAAGGLRSEPRVEVRAPVGLHHAGGRCGGETHDLTPSGVCVEFDRDDWTPQPGEAFTLELPAPTTGDLAAGAPRTLRCVVRHRTPGARNTWRVGAAFAGTADASTPSLF